MGRVGDHHIGFRHRLHHALLLALGADFVFLGRPFIYGAAALGRYGGDHTVEILLDDLRVNMIQMGFASLDEIAAYAREQKV